MTTTYRVSCFGPAPSDFEIEDGATAHVVGLKYKHNSIIAEKITVQKKACKCGRRPAIAGKKEESVSKLGGERIAVTGQVRDFTPANGGFEFELFV
jgi:hypothetical protein